mmetsp:Transcript_48527/g.105773  ORF Transcript_48527/g.105773 Transcript_48527/m.105773 type:complete len:128 (-) Transcript_48527:222-605(-)
MSTIFHHHDAYQYATLIEAIRAISKKSPSIVFITDRIYYWDSFFYILMEFAAGADLREFTHSFNTRCLSKRASKYVMEQAIDVMGKLWDMDLFHRDIKGNNFVVSDYDFFPDNSKEIDSFNCLDLKI